MKKFLSGLTVVAFSIDWYSTIIQRDWRVEENPIVRMVWRETGDLGMTLFSLVLLLAVLMLIEYGSRARGFWLTALALFILVAFKLLIALTNLNLIPYWVTGWFHL